VISLRPLDSSGTFNAFQSFPSKELFFIHGLSFALSTKLSQRLPSLYTYILRHDSFTRFLEHSGGMIRDNMYASSCRYHPSYHIILCPIGEAHSNVLHILHCRRRAAPELNYARSAIRIENFSKLQSTFSRRAIPVKAQWLEVP
jgi:hypothetical protein